MRHVLTALALATAALPPGAFAQKAGDGQCIVAGRITGEHRWAPRLPHVTLVAERGRVVTKGDKEWLNDVRRVRLTRPALLSRCDGDDQLADGDALAPQEKADMPALRPGLYEVQAVHFPRLRRGGELVELQVRVPQDAVVTMR
jgi:hypothetical protein